MNRLFVYGIFLGEHNRNRYGMTDPRYATVANYITQGDQIVEAVPVDAKFRTALTGLIVDVNPNQWDRLDALERAYDRLIITTTNDERAYMYVQKGRR